MITQLHKRNPNSSVQLHSYCIPLLYVFAVLSRKSAESRESTEPNRLNVGNWVLEVQCSMFDVRCWTFDVRHLSSRAYRLPLMGWNLSKIRMLSLRCKDTLRNHFLTPLFFT